MVTFSSTLNGPARIDFTTNDTIHGRISGLTGTAAVGCIQPVGATGCQGPNAPFQSLVMSGWAWDAASQLWRIQYPAGSFPQGWYEGFARDPLTQVTSALTRIVVGLPSGTSGLCASVPRPPGWVRSLTQTSVSQVQWIEVVGALWTPFPNSGGSGRIATNHGEYLALEFTTPSDPTACAAAQSKLFLWVPSQVDGEADMSKTVVTISQCPGDFRFPTDAVAPATDPTYARGCRNFRRRQGSPVSVTSNIRYRIGAGPSDEFTCELACGQTYFLNFVRADPGSVGPVTMMFEGVTSRWTTCSAWPASSVRVCAACSASRTAPRTRRVASSGMRSPRRASADSSWLSVSPSTYSMARKGRPSTSPRSNTWQMLG